MIFVAEKVLGGYKVFDITTSETLIINDMDLGHAISLGQCLNARMEDRRVVYLAGCSYSLREHKRPGEPSDNFIMAEVYHSKKKKVVGYQVLQAVNGRYESYRLKVDEAIERHKQLRFTNVKCDGKKLYPKYGMLYRIDISSGDVVKTSSKKVLEYKKREGQDSADIAMIEAAKKNAGKYKNGKNDSAVNYVDEKMKKGGNHKRTAVIAASILVMGLSLASQFGGNKGVEPVVSSQISSGIKLHTEVPKDDLSTVIRLNGVDSVSVSGGDVFVDGLKVANINFNETNNMTLGGIRSLYDTNLTETVENRVQQGDFIAKTFLGENTPVNRDVGVSGRVKYSFTGKYGNYTVNSKQGILDPSYTISLDGSTIYEAKFDKDGNTTVNKAENIESDIGMLDAISLLVQLYNDDHNVYMSLLEAE